MRKSKFDKFILYSENENKIILMHWDTSCNGIADWWHFDGERCWWETGNGYLKKALNKYKVIDRSPEWTYL